VKPRDVDAAAEAKDFGRESHLKHNKRYRRGREFAMVVRGLWDSWDDDAFIRDRKSGRFFLPDGMHVLNHQETYFKIRVPLNVARSPQGRPVMVQAGSSETERSLLRKRPRSCSPHIRMSRARGPFIPI
jgi:alkanesulfonate monooxygenase SsuD/methylene tetrahydromethanopterin reductase-like flavin-dependent oxidoreductase (luciferase family)